jgi:hypothetical protein
VPHHAVQGHERRGDRATLALLVRQAAAGEQQSGPVKLSADN